MSGGPSQERISLSEILEQARTLLDTGSLEKAFELLGSIEGHDEQPEVAALRKLAGERLWQDLSLRFGPDTLIRRLPVENLRSLPLTAADAFVLSLCNEPTTVADLLALIPRPEFDCLRTLGKLTGLGLIEGGVGK